MAPSRLFKQFFKAPYPLFFGVFIFLVCFRLAADCGPISSRKNQAPVLESLWEMNVLEDVRSFDPSAQLSSRVLFSQTALDEDFDGDEEDFPAACLKFCYFLVPTDHSELFLPDIKFRQAQLGTLLFLFERPPPPLFPEFLVACRVQVRFS